MPNINKAAIADALLRENGLVGQAVAMIAQAVEDSAEHRRSSTVGLTLKVSFDKDNPFLMHLIGGTKIKTPKGRRLDHVLTGDEEHLLSYRISEDTGQASLFGELDDA